MQSFLMSHAVFQGLSTCFLFSFSFKLFHNFCITSTCPTLVYISKSPPFSLDVDNFFFVLELDEQTFCQKEFYINLQKIILLWRTVNLPLRKLCEIRRTKFFVGNIYDIFIYNFIRNFLCPIWLLRRSTLEWLLLFRFNFTF